MEGAAAVRRHHLLLGSSLVAVVAMLAGCSGGTAPAPTAADQGSETFSDLPTANASAGDPFDTIPPNPTAASSDAVPATIGCAITPTLVAPGQVFVLTLFESSGWFGKDRYFQITGLPSSYHELHTADGGEGQRVLWTENGPEAQGTSWVVAVFMRDWDIHGIRPDNGMATFVRPGSTQHEGSCEASVQVSYIP